MIQNKKIAKDLYVLGCFFILPLILLFLFYKAIYSCANKEKKILDQYMYDLIKNKIVYNKTSFYKAVIYHEKRIMFNKTKWFFRLTIISSLIFLILFKKDFFNFVISGLNILPSFKWPTVFETNNTLINSNNIHVLNLPENFIVSLFPIIVFKYCNFSSIVFCCSIAYNLLLFICGFFIIRACLGTFFRIKRANKIAFELYNKKKIVKNIIQPNYSNIINSKIPNQEKYQRNMR